MIAVSLTTEQRAAWRGDNVIKLRTETGKPAMINEADAPVAFNTLTGDGVGNVEEIGTYEENGVTGTTIAVNVGSATAGASEVELSVDADNDAGEVRALTLVFNLTVNAPEAAAFDVPTPVIEPIA